MALARPLADTCLFNTKKGKANKILIFLSTLKQIFYILQEKIDVKIDLQIQILRRNTNRIIMVKLRSDSDVQIDVQIDLQIQI